MYNLPLLKNSGLFENIDIQFGGFMAALSEIDDGAVTLAAAIVSRSTRNGDVCIELAAYAGLKMTGAADKPGSVTCPPLKQWCETLLQSKIVGEAGEYRPMILDGQNRLYLYRFWEYEKKLADFLLEPTAPPLPDINAATFKAGLERLFLRGGFSNGRSNDTNALGHSNRDSRDSVGRCPRHRWSLVRVLQRGLGGVWSLRSGHCTGFWSPCECDAKGITPTSEV